MDRLTRGITLLPEFRALIRFSACQFGPGHDFRLRLFREPDFAGQMIMALNSQGNWPSQLGRSRFHSYKEESYPVSSSRLCKGCCRHISSQMGTR